MNSTVLPPGTILQRLYLQERLQLMKSGHFLEVGCGRGFISKLLLDLGWSGVGYDLNQNSLEYAAQLNNKSVRIGKFSVENKNFLDIKTASSLRFDLVISCMVLEHLNDDEELAYFEKVKNILTTNGKMILLVPSCPDYWGCEDEIAGHYRRYTFADLASKLNNANFTINDMAGLTYPISNILYPISEFLVSRVEGKLTSQTMLERTKKSGNRSVPFKTKFPNLFKLFLNEVTIYPFHFLQKSNKRNKRSLVIYAEGTLNSST